MENKEFKELLLADRHLFEDDDSFKVEVPSPRSLEQMAAYQRMYDICIVKINALLEKEINNSWKINITPQI